MMYMGSKNKLAKQLLPIILANRKPGQLYVEPFAGGFNMIDKVTGPRLAADSNFYITELFNALCNGWVPPVDVSRVDYYQIKNTPHLYPPYLVAFVASCCSFGAKWWGGYATSKSGMNHAAMNCRNLMKQVPNIRGVEIKCCNYWELEIPRGSLIYCDPPYAGTTQYKNNFNSEAFWNWVRLYVAMGYEIYISEYNAPTDFVCVFEKEHVSTLTKNDNKKSTIERLFVHESMVY